VTWDKTETNRRDWVRAVFEIAGRNEIRTNDGRDAGRAWMLWLDKVAPYLLANSPLPDLRLFSVVVLTGGKQRRAISGRRLLGNQF